MSCILRHQGIQLILAYSWADRLAILVAGKGREGECFYFFCFFTFVYVPLSYMFLSFISSTISKFYPPGVGGGGGEGMWWVGGGRGCGGGGGNFLYMA